MAEILRPDLCVIGGGAAGLAVAAAARALGASVVLIERDRMGGECLNSGCIPSRALIAAARQAALGPAARPFGISYAGPDIDFTRVRAHIEETVRAIAPHDSAERFIALGTTVLREGARFIDRRTVAAGATMVRARRFVIATGSRPAIPPIPGLDTLPYLTSETVFGLTERPGHLVVVGGGPTGIELAQAYRRLGARVTVIEQSQALARHDPELANIALQRLEADGVVVRTETEVLNLARVDGDIAVTVTSGAVRETISGTHLLVATGRVAATADLDLAAAHIRADASGIRVNARLCTSNRRVYAIGDAMAGGVHDAATAPYHAGLVVRSALFGMPVRLRPERIPRVTFTDPEIAQVGLGEAEARRRHGDRFRILRWSYGENDRARTDRGTAGFVKLIADRRGRILGCGIVGAGASELIALFAFAIANGLGVASLKAFVAPYPSLSDLAKRVGMAFYEERPINPWIGRWMQLIRLLP